MESPSENECYRGCSEQEHQLGGSRERKEAAPDKQGEAALSFPSSAPTVSGKMRTKLRHIVEKQ